MNNVKPLAGEAYRVAEDQSRKALRGLVDSDAEHDLLERLIESTKPAKPPGEAFENLDFLLWTPFRYRPLLTSGTRFGTYRDPAVWYGAEHVETALAEKAYYLLRVREESDATFAPEHQVLSSFHIPLHSPRGVDLHDPAFKAHREDLLSATSHGAAQAFGQAARGCDVQLIRFPSVRDPKHRPNFAAFSPSVFAASTPLPSSRWQWRVLIQSDRVIYERKNAIQFTPHTAAEPTLTFNRSDFLVEGKFPIVS